MSDCSDTFKLWFARAGAVQRGWARNNASMGDRYGLLWHAYRAGWYAHERRTKARKAVSRQVLGSPGLPANDSGCVVVQTEGESDAES